MHTVFVHIQVIPVFQDKFIAETIINADASRKEEGVRRFDIYQQKQDPNKFLLFEVYRTPQDQETHRDTDHYKAWRDSVAEMMAEPRKGITYTQIY